MLGAQYWAPSGQANIVSALGGRNLSKSEASKSIINLAKVFPFSLNNTIYYTLVYLEGLWSTVSVEFVAFHQLLHRA